MTFTEFYDTKKRMSVRDGADYLYVVETQVGNTWENVWCEDDKPMTFVSEDEAEAEIEDTLECMQSAYMRGDMSLPMSREEFRIVQTTR